MTERITLDVQRLGAQGDGIADTSDGPVYISGVLPGERATVEVDGNRGLAIDILDRSPQRADPACQHFGVCGGCTAQHMAASLYVEWKRDMVRTAFAHRGLEPAIEEVVVVPAGSRRRATFAARRAQGEVILGFHEEGSHRLVDLLACPVMMPPIERSIPALRQIAEVLLPAAPAEPLRLSVTAATEGLDLALADLAGKIEPAAQSRIAEIAIGAGIVRVSAANNLVMQSALPHLLLAGANVALPPASFAQATREAEEAIAAVLADATRRAKHVADLFCGLGTFTFGMARRARVLAVDGDRPALAALAAAAKATPGIKPVETRARDLMREPLSRMELGAFDAVVLDPPRAGAKAQAEALTRARVPVVCAVSCNPATLARDCRILVDGGYTIERVLPVDQFLWSPHVEAVAVLRRGK
jgi:23S rRNA (uracil1939-C5)-methyltransferase